VDTRRSDRFYPPEFSSGVSDSTPDAAFLTPRKLPSERYGAARTIGYHACSCPGSLDPRRRQRRAASQDGRESMRLAAILTIAIAALTFVPPARRSVLHYLLRWRARGRRLVGPLSTADQRAPRGALDRRGELDRSGIADRRAIPPLPPERQAASLRRAVLRALARQEFALCYQPMLDLRSGRVVGARALLRWRHPELGLLAPAEFIDEFEHCGLTLPVGAWVLATAAAQAARWIEQGCSLTVSLPLSARQFFQPDLAVDFAALLHRAGLPACHIELALDLAMLIDKRQDCEAILERWRQCGMGLAIRDANCRGPFNYLRRFAVDALWLDAAAADGARLNAAPAVDAARARAQVAEPAEAGMAEAEAGTVDAQAGAGAGAGAGPRGEPGARAPLRAAVELAHALGRRVVAGPVATPAQLARLAALGCDQAYGDAVGAAVPAEALVAALRAGAPAWQLSAATPAPAPSAAADAVHRPADSACR
jgi:EAL domain-containing protein (putative c-di-GMP-specific phosphodiesterase class I)